MVLWRSRAVPRALGALLGLLLCCPSWGQDPATIDFVREKSLGSLPSITASMDLITGSSRMVTGSEDGSVWLWAVPMGENASATSSRVLGRLVDGVYHHNGRVTCVSVAPDGSRFLSAGGAPGNLQIFVWHMNGTERLQSWNVLGVLTPLGNLTSPVTSMSWSVNGEQALISDGVGTTIIWSVRGSEPRDWYPQREFSGLFNATLSPDGSKMVGIDSSSRRASIWNVTDIFVSNWAPLRQALGSLPCQTAAWSRDSRRVVLGASSTMEFWMVYKPDPSQWGVTAILPTDSPSQSLTFGDAAHLVRLTLSAPAFVEVWNVNELDNPLTWSKEGSFGLRNGGLTAFTVVEGSRVVLTAEIGQGVQAWVIGNSDSDRWPLIGHPRPFSTTRSLAFPSFPAVSADGRQLAAGDSRSGTIQILDINQHPDEPAKWSQKAALLGFAYSVAFDDDGKRLIAGIGNQVVVFSTEDGTWSSPGSKMLGTHGGNGTFPTMVKFTASGKYAVSTGADAVLKVWDVSGSSPENWHLAKSFGPVNGSSLFFSTVDVAPDDSVVAVASGGAVKLWSISGPSTSWRSVPEKVLSTPNPVACVANATSFVSFCGAANRLVMSCLAPGLADGTGTTPLSWTKGSLKIWWQDSTSEWKHQHLNSTEMVWGLDCSANFAVTGSIDNTVKLWNIYPESPSTWGLLRFVGSHNTSVAPETTFSPPSGAVTVTFTATVDSIVSSGTAHLRKWSLDSVNTSEIADQEHPCYWRRWWDDQVLEDYLALLGMYPARDKRCNVVTCSLDSHGYPMCKLKATSHDFMRKSQVPYYSRLVQDYYVPPLDLGFGPTLLAGVGMPDLPIPPRTYILRLNNTGISGDVTNFISLNKTGLHYLQEVDMSQNPSIDRYPKDEAPPPALRILRLANTSVTCPTPTPCTTKPCVCPVWAAWLELELLDLRGTPADNNMFQGLVFKSGLPMCEFSEVGYKDNGTLCSVCEARYFWNYKGATTGGSCETCFYITWKEVLITLLVLIVVLAVAAAFIYKFVGFATVAGQAKTLVQALMEWYQKVALDLGFLAQKARDTLFAYQKVSQLRNLAAPLPRGTPTAIANQAATFTLDWLSNQGFATCYLGGTYYTSWLLMALQAALVMVTLWSVSPLFKVERADGMRFAHSFNALTVAVETFPLFLCDSRLQDTSLPVKQENRRAYMWADYRIDCDSSSHKTFRFLAGLGCCIYCLGVPVMQYVRLFLSRNILNPPIPGIDIPLDQEEADALESELTNKVEHDWGAETGCKQYVQGVECILDHLRKERLKHTPDVGYGAKLGRSRLFLPSCEVLGARLRGRIATNPDTPPDVVAKIKMVLNLNPSKWWWFPMPTIGRVLIALAFVCEPAFQPFVGAMICFSLGIAVLWQQPYIRKSDNNHEAVCQISVGAAFAANSVPRSSPSAKIFMTLIFLVPGLTFLYYTISHFRSKRFVVEEYAMYRFTHMDELIEPKKEQKDEREEAAASSSSSSSQRPEDGSKRPSVQEAPQADLELQRLPQASSNSAAQPLIPPMSPSATEGSQGDDSWVPVSPPMGHPEEDETPRAG